MSLWEIPRPDTASEIVTTGHLKKVLHFSCSIFYLYLVYFDWTTLNWPERPVFDKLNKFTNWNYTMLTLYWLVSLANDFIDSKWVSLSLQHDMLLVIIIPCSVVVCIGFWAMHSVDPKLIRCGNFFQNVGKCPMWYSHATHTLVLVLPLVDSLLCLVEQLNSLSNYQALQQSCFGPMRKICIFIVYTGAYSFVVFYLGLKKSLWPYPFMSKLSLPSKILLGLFCTFCGLTAMLGLNNVYEHYVTLLGNQMYPKVEPTLWDKLGISSFLKLN